MLAELDRHPHARAVLAPALETGGRASHAYLFYGPGGAGKRSAARAMAAELLAAGSPDPASARARVESGAHPDLTWVAPSGAHEILVSDIDGPVVSAVSKTPFEAACRVFVIERVDELGDEAANRMLKTLEEPPSFVHLILLSDRLAEVLPTIRSRCQLVRFDAPTVQETAANLEALGEDAKAAVACAQLALGDGERARELTGAEGKALRATAERFARAAISGEMARDEPWVQMLAAVRAQGEEPTRGSTPESARRSSSTPARSASGSRPSGRSGSGGPGGGSRPRPSIWPSRWSRSGTPTSRRSPGTRPTS